MPRLLERGVARAARIMFYTNNAYWFRMSLEEEVRQICVADDFRASFGDPEETIRYIKDFGYFYPMELDIGLSEGHLFANVKHEDEIVGYNKTGYGKVYIQDFKKAFLFPERVAFTYDTFIDRKYRNRNLGAFLLNEVCKKLRELGYKSLWAHIPPWNHASISMHQKLGFRRLQLISYYRVAGVSWVTENPVKVIHRIEDAFQR